MISTDIACRVFRLHFNGKTGTCYAFDCNGTQFIVSASHIFKDVVEVTCIKLYHERSWKDLDVQVVYNSGENADTIIFKTAIRLAPDYIGKFGHGNTFMGTWCYIYGFPFALSNHGEEINRNFPIPFVKAALLSAVDNSKEKVVDIYLDGHNNQGFSGGPVVWYNRNNPQDFTIIGTVSGYLTEPAVSSVTKEDIDLFGVNSGIIRVFGLKDIKKIMMESV